MQTRRASAVEAVVNTAVGFVIAWVAQWVICWAYDIPMNEAQLTIMVFWMTIISVVRSYGIRRLWNSEFWRKNGRSASKGS